MKKLNQDTGNSGSFFFNNDLKSILLSILEIFGSVRICEFGQVELP